MRKLQTETIIYFFFIFIFIYGKVYIYQKIQLENLSLYCYIYITFFCVAGYWKCSNKTPTPIQICTGLVDVALRPKFLAFLTRYFNVDFDSNGLMLLFYVFERSITPNNRKQPDLLTAELFFKLCIPQRYVHNLKPNWKDSVCIGVKNLTNL